MKIVFVAIVSFLLGIGLLFYISRPDENELRIVTKSIDRTIGSGTIHAEYPQFPDISDDFNEKIKKTILNAMEQFENASEENSKIRKQTSDEEENLVFDHSLNIRWSAEQLNSKIISFALRSSYYVGGAHGGQDIFTFSFDVGKNKEITLGTIFLNNPDYLEKISQFVIKDLKNQMSFMGDMEPNLDMIGQGASPIEKNFKNFTISSEKTIIFYFPQYQVAPYSAGEQKVIMPISYIGE